MQWHEHINFSKSLIIQRLCILKRLAGRKGGCHPKLILDFYKLYICSILEYGIQVFSVRHPSLFKIIESLQNFAIQIAVGVHKHSSVQVRNIVWIGVPK